MAIFNVNEIINNGGSNKDDDTKETDSLINSSPTIISSDPNNPSLSLAQSSSSVQNTYINEDHDQTLKKNQTLDAMKISDKNSGAKNHFDDWFNRNHNHIYRNCHHHHQFHPSNLEQQQQHNHHCHHQHRQSNWRDEADGSEDQIRLNLMTKNNFHPNNTFLDYNFSPSRRSNFSPIVNHSSGSSNALAAENQSDKPFFLGQTQPEPSQHLIDCDKAIRSNETKFQNKRLSSQHKNIQNLKQMLDLVDSFKSSLNISPETYQRSATTCTRKNSNLKFNLTNTEMPGNSEQNYNQTDSRSSDPKTINNFRFNFETHSASRNVRNNPDVEDLHQKVQTFVHRMERLIYTNLQANDQSCQSPKNHFPSNLTYENVDDNSIQASNQNFFNLDYMKTLNEQIFQLLLAQNSQINKQQQLLQSWIETQSDLLLRYPTILQERNRNLNINNLFKTNQSESLVNILDQVNDHESIAVPNQNFESISLNKANNHSTLNNQTIPGNRNNNFWDDFKSRTFQNKLQSNFTSNRDSQINLDSNRRISTNSQLFHFQCNDHCRSACNKNSRSHSFPELIDSPKFSLNDRVLKKNDNRIISNCVVDNLTSPKLDKQIKKSNYCDSPQPKNTPISTFYRNRNHFILNETPNSFCNQSSKQASSSMENNVVTVKSDSKIDILPVSKKIKIGEIDATEAADDSFEFLDPRRMIKQYTSDLNPKECDDSEEIIIADSKKSKCENIRPLMPAEGMCYNLHSKTKSFGTILKSSSTSTSKTKSFRPPTTGNESILENNLNYSDENSIADSLRSMSLIESSKERNDDNSLSNSINAYDETDSVASSNKTISSSEEHISTHLKSSSATNSLLKNFDQNNNKRVNINNGNNLIERSTSSIRQQTNNSTSSNVEGNFDTESKIGTKELMDSLSNNDQSNHNWQNGQNSNGTKKIEDSHSDYDEDGKNDDYGNDDDYDEDDINENDENSIQMIPLGNGNAEEIRSNVRLSGDGEQGL